MIDDRNFQIQLFNHIKGKLNGASLVDEISEVLSISTDSAYRRIRSDKFMVLPEIIRLCHHFNIALGDLVDISDRKVVSFCTRFPEHGQLSVSKFLNSLRSEAGMITAMENPRLFFVINDLNLFQILQVKELAAFKFYYWKRSYLDHTKEEPRPFTYTDHINEYGSQAEALTKAYIETESWEMISSDMLVATQRQILQYLELGYIDSREVAIHLLGKLIDLADHLCLQAENGRKFAFGQSPVSGNGVYRLYFNDVLTVDNLLLVGSHDDLLTYHTNSIINLMKSNNRTFYEFNLKMANNLVRGSELISNTGERVRNRVFHGMKSNVQACIGKLSGN